MTRLTAAFMVLAACAINFLAGLVIGGRVEREKAIKESGAPFVRFYLEGDSVSVSQASSARWLRLRMVGQNADSGGALPESEKP